MKFPQDGSFRQFDRPRSQLLSKVLQRTGIRSLGVSFFRGPTERVGFAFGFPFRQVQKGYPQKVTDRRSRDSYYVLNII